MKSEFGRSGKSHRFNRVTFPSFSDIENTYKSLPDTYTVGMISEIEDLGFKAVLCKNGNTALGKWLMTESKSRWIEDTNLAATTARRASSVEVVTAAALTAASLPEDSLTGGFLWITGGTGLKEDGAGNKTLFRKLLIAGNDAGNNSANQSITINLAAPLPVALDTTTDVLVEGSAYFNTGAGTTTTANKALGMTVLPVPANEYYWAVFYGDMPTENAITGTPAAGNPVGKIAGGGLGKKTASTIISGQILGHVKYQGTQDIVTLDIRGIDLQPTQKAA